MPSRPTSPADRSGGPVPPSWGQSHPATVVDAEGPDDVTAPDHDVPGGANTFSGNDNRTARRSSSTSMTLTPRPYEPHGPVSQAQGPADRDESSPNRELARESDDSR